jgi:predicted phosphohydrolase
MKKYVWYTDTHLNWVLPWNKFRFVKRIEAENPNGIFLTGDISHGISIKWDLKYLAKHLDIPIYFVLGNHDYHYRTMENVHNDVRELCDQYPNLHWMTESDIISLNKKTAIIGAEGWYDARVGDSKYLKYTLDSWVTTDFRKLSDAQARLKKFRELADASAFLIKNKLEEALQNHKVVYILTHYPPWQQATRDIGTFMERFWLPYNTNIIMGQTIEQVMANYKKKKVIVLAGHTHTDSWIHISKRIECKVNKASYLGLPRNEECIFI